MTRTTLAVLALAMSLTSTACMATAQDVAAADEPKGCIFRGKQHAVGERWTTGPPDKCAKYLCEGDGQIAALTCPWFVPAPGCTAVPGDDNAVYPGCCPLRKCHSGHDDERREKDTAAAAKDEAVATTVVRGTWGGVTEAMSVTDGKGSPMKVLTATMAPTPARLNG